MMTSDDRERRGGDADPRHSAHTVNIAGTNPRALLPLPPLPIIFEISFVISRKRTAAPCVSRVTLVRRSASATSTESLSLSLSLSLSTLHIYDICRA